MHTGELEEPVSPPQGCNGREGYAGSKTNFALTVVLGRAQRTGLEKRGLIDRQKRWNQANISVAWGAEGSDFSRMAGL